MLNAGSKKTSFNLLLDHNVILEIYYDLLSKKKSELLNYLYVFSEKKAIRIHYTNFNFIEICRSTNFDQVFGIFNVFARIPNLYYLNTESNESQPSTYEEFYQRAIYQLKKHGSSEVLEQLVKLAKTDSRYTPALASLEKIEKNDLLNLETAFSGVDIGSVIFLSTPHNISYR